MEDKDAEMLPGGPMQYENKCPPDTPDIAYMENTPWSTWLDRYEKLTGKKFIEVKPGDRVIEYPFALINGHSYDSYIPRGFRHGLVTGYGPKPQSVIIKWDEDRLHNMPFYFIGDLVPEKDAKEG